MNSDAFEWRDDNAFLFEKGATYRLNTEYNKNPERLHLLDTIDGSINKRPWFYFWIASSFLASIDSC